MASFSEAFSLPIPTKAVFGDNVILGCSAISPMTMMSIQMGSMGRWYYNPYASILLPESDLIIKTISTSVPYIQQLKV